MSNDLIRREDVLDWINENANLFSIYGTPSLNLDSAWKMYDFVRNIPAAYDTQKVTEELEMESKLYSLSSRDCEFAIPQNKALEIVRKGGKECIQEVRNGKS